MLIVTRYQVHRNRKDQETAAGRNENGLTMFLRPACSPRHWKRHRLVRRRRRSWSLRPAWNERRNWHLIGSGRSLAVDTAPILPTAALAEGDADANGRKGCSRKDWRFSW